MNKLPRLVICALTLLLVGCTPEISLNPLFDESKKESILFENLAGEWKVQPTQNSGESDANTRWVFKRSEDGKGYDLSTFSINENGNYLSNVHILKLNDYLFVDMAPNQENPYKNESKPFPTISGHIIGRIWVDENSVRIHVLDEAWVIKRIKAGTLGLDSTETPDGTILTATTEQLRKFAVDHADDKEAFSLNYDLIKVR
jgi:hypothetical protein